MGLGGLAGLTRHQQGFVLPPRANEFSTGFGMARSQLSLVFTTAYCFEGPDFKARISKTVSAFQGKKKKAEFTVVSLLHLSCGGRQLPFQTDRKRKGQRCLWRRTDIRALFPEVGRRGGFPNRGLRWDTGQVEAGVVGPGAGEKP